MSQEEFSTEMSQEAEFYMETIIKRLNSCKNVEQQRQAATIYLDLCTRLILTIAVNTNAKDLLIDLTIDCLQKNKQEIHKLNK